MSETARRPHPGPTSADRRALDHIGCGGQHTACRPHTSEVSRPSRRRTSTSALLWDHWYRWSCPCPRHSKIFCSKSSAT